jgi:deoxyribonuclease-4
MAFINDLVRIGPPAVNKDLFKVERKGKIVQGTREDIPAYLASLGLNLYEYSAGRGIKFKNREDLAEFRENCKKNNIYVTIHGPYYISLASESPETLQRSIERIGELYQAALWLGAKRAVIHAGSYASHGTPEGNLKLTIDSLKKGIELAKANYKNEFPEFKDIALCPETMGSVQKIDAVEEIIRICEEVGTNYCIPTIDFGHLYAGSCGKIDSKDAYLKIFDKVEKKLGKQVAENLHIHYSKVEYTGKGEKMHHPNTVTEWGPKYEPLLEIIHECGYKPTIVNESPDLETDAKIIMDYYRNISHSPKKKESTATIPAEPAKKASKKTTQK